MFLSVVFDLDGTLLNTLEDLAKAANFALGALGLPTHPVEDYRLMVGHGIPHLVQSMLPESCRDDKTRSEALALFSSHYAQHMFDTTAPYAGVEEMLAKLRCSGMQLGLLSNKAHVYVEEMAGKWFSSCFTASAGLREGVPPKPDPTSLLALLEEMGAQKSSTLYCGDSDVDILTGRNAGIATCGVLWGFRSREELLQAGADYLVANPEALTRLVTGNG